MRVFKQFYIEFRCDAVGLKVLPELVAVVANAINTSEFTCIEYRRKHASAHEYRLVNEEGIEAKVGYDYGDFDAVPKIWLHLSAPEHLGLDLRELAYEIINHPKFLKVNREKGGDG